MTSFTATARRYAETTVYYNPNNGREEMHPLAESMLIRAIPQLEHYDKESERLRNSLDTHAKQRQDLQKTLAKVNRSAWELLRTIDNDTKDLRPYKRPPTSPKRVVDEPPPKRPWGVWGVFCFSLTVIVGARLAFAFVTYLLS